MSQAAPRQSEVKDHYRQLASEYSERANPTCEAVYEKLARRFLSGRGSILELGGGSSELLERLGVEKPVACDVSEAMLRARRHAGDGATRLVVAAGERLPFESGRFDGVLCVNVLEHVADVPAVLAEVARVLRPGGLFLAITPNGNWETLLDLAERWRLKIPEGPHAFLKTARLAEVAAPHFRTVEHRTMLAFPSGGPRIARLIDVFSGCALLGGGFGA
ncbi:MAG: class I SAM-dependent methyltransferase [Isosphaeraceae bacterium]